MQRAIVTRRHVLYTRRAVRSGALARRRRGEVRNARMMSAFAIKSRTPMTRAYRFGQEMVRLVRLPRCVYER